MIGNTLKDSGTLRAGIDKLVLHTFDYEVTDTTPLVIDGTRKQAGQSIDELTDTPLFSCNGTKVYGTKAHRNTDTYGLDINPHGCRVILNPSKVLHPNTARLCTEPDELMEVLRHVERALSDVVRLNIHTATLVRADLAKQWHMPRPVFAYAPAFDAMRLKGTRSRNVNHGAETFGIRNNTTEAAFYDKLREMKPDAAPSEFMRAELRLRKASAVARYLHAATPDKLIHAGNGAWNEAFNTFMEGKVFASVSGNQMAFDFAELSAGIDAIRAMEPRNFVSRLIEVMGTRAIFDEIGMHRFIDVLRIKGIPDRTIRYAREKLMRNAPLSAAIGRPVALHALIDELRILVNAA